MTSTESNKMVIVDPSDLLCYNDSLILHNITMGYQLHNVVNIYKHKHTNPKYIPTSYNFKFHLKNFSRITFFPIIIGVGHSIFSGLAEAMYEGIYEGVKKGIQKS